MTLPTVKVELGRLTGWTLGTSLLGTSTYLATYTYSDITSRVMDFSVRRGRQHELDRIEAGTASLTLINQDGAFTPTNTSSTYYPDIRPMAPIRISATWEPILNVSGLLAWYDFSDATSLFTDTARTTPVVADGDAIRGVTDKSGAGNHLVSDAAGNSPLYKTGANGINSLSVALFDGTDDRLNRTPLTQGTIAQPGTQFAVVRTSAAATAQIATDGRGDASNRWAILNSGTNMGWYAGTTQNIVAADTNNHIMAVTYQGASSKGWRDGGANVNLNVGTQSLVGMSLGAEQSSPSVVPWIGKIAEVATYSGALSLADINIIGNALGTKWGITWTTAT